MWLCVRGGVFSLYPSLPYTSGLLTGPFSSYFKFWCYENAVMNAVMKFGKMRHKTSWFFFSGTTVHPPSYAYPIQGREGRAVVYLSCRRPRGGYALDRWPVYPGVEFEKRCSRKILTISMRRCLFFTQQEGKLLFDPGRRHRSLWGCVSTTADIHLNHFSYFISLFYLFFFLVIIVLFLVALTSFSLLFKLVSLVVLFWGFLILKKGKAHKPKMPCFTVL